jgi:hypothetical protein
MFVYKARYLHYTCFKNSPFDSAQDMALKIVNPLVFKTACATSAGSVQRLLSNFLV